MYVYLWIISLKQMVSVDLLWHFIVSGGWWLTVGKSQCTQYVKIRLAFFATANCQIVFQQMWQFYQDAVKITATHWQIQSGSCSALWYHSGLFPVSGDFVLMSSLITWSFQMAHCQFFRPSGWLTLQPHVTLPGFFSLQPPPTHIITKGTV